MTDFLSLWPWRGPIAGADTMQGIAERVASQHGLTVAALKGPRQDHAHASARWQAFSEMYATKRYTIPQIAAFLGKNTATVQYGIRRHAGESNQSARSRRALARQEAA